MVYCGKPSKGCENCRSLHTKCDQKYPACSRCERLKKTCVGYRDESKLIFRDETARTQSKIRRRRADWAPNLSDHPIPSPSRPFAPQSQDVAVCFFYHTTLNNLSEKDPARQVQLYLPSLYARSKIGSALRLATASISYVLAPDVVRDADRAARKRYGQALDAIQHAIRDPTEAGNDETLYAILLLCGYETITREKDLPSAWGTHVGGAAALVRYRGSSQLQSQLAQGLFCFVRKSIVLSHMQTCHPVDEVFTEWDVCAEPENRLVAIAARIPAIQQLGYNLLLQPDKATDIDLENLIHSATTLDQQLSDWAGNLPNTWSYGHATELRDTKMVSMFSPKHIHRYPDFYVARVWNFYRVSRLILQSLHYRATSLQQRPGELEKTEAMNQTEVRKKIFELVNDICASVPFLLGRDLSRMTVPVTSEKSQRNAKVWEAPPVNWGDGKQAKSTPTGSFSLIWPLHVASSAIAIPEDQRKWIHKQLENIAASGDSQAQLALATKSQTLLGGPDSLQFDCV